MILFINYLVVFYLTIHLIRTRSRFNQIVYLFIGIDFAVTRRFSKSAGLATNPTERGFYDIGIGGLTWARHIYEADRLEYRIEKGRI